VSILRRTRQRPKAGEPAGRILCAEGPSKVRYLRVSSGSEREKTGAREGFDEAGIQVRYQTFNIEFSNYFVINYTKEWDLRLTIPVELRYSPILIPSDLSLIFKFIANVKSAGWDFRGGSLLKNAVCYPIFLPARRGGSG
jgi:hypothetical protein